MNKPTTSDQKVITYFVRSKDRWLLKEYLDEPPITCYSVANNFIGFAVKEKGIRYFFPKGAQILLVRGELICIVGENFVTEPIESLA